MKKAAIGFRVHSGWTALVVVSLEEGVPVVLKRQRVSLVKIFNYSFRQPYHSAQRMELQDAIKFVNQVRSEAEGLAYAALSSMQTELSALGYRVDRGGLLLASGRPLPELQKNSVVARADSHCGWRTVPRSAACRRFPL